MALNAHYFLQDFIATRYFLQENIAQGSSIGCGFIGRMSNSSCQISRSLVETGDQWEAPLKSVAPMEVTLRHVW